MLVLSRKKDETIVIGDDITIKVVRISGGRVRLAIDAPKHVKVSRGEIFDPALLKAEPTDDLERFQYTVS